MNKKIDALMKAAMSQAWSMEDRDGDIDKLYIPNLFAETFTAAIVQECIKVTAQSVGNEIPWSLELKKHFGIN